MEEGQSFLQMVLEQGISSGSLWPYWCYFQFSRKQGSKLDSLGKYGGQLVDLAAGPRSKEEREGEMH